MSKIYDIVSRYNEDPFEEPTSASAADSSARPQTQSYGQIPGTNTINTGRT